MAPALAAPTSYSWRLWSTYAFLAVDRPDLLPRARRIADELLAGVEDEVSRFRADSDLSRANARAGSWSSAGPLLVGATRAALRAAGQTDGLVDPCLGHALVSLGYDDLARVQRRTTWRPVAALPRLGAWQELEVTDDAVRVPSGTSLDLGATAKAWAADVVAATVSQTLGCVCVVSLGGDVSVQGPEASWPVTVAETPDGDGPVVQVEGGLATSSTLVRRWRGPRGSVTHHVLDPRTGLPAAEVHRTATCVGATTLAANTASTAALVLGEDAPAWLAAQGVSARLVRADGTVVRVGDWPQEA